MKNNLNLNKAKKEKNDEYFTLYEDVVKIFKHLNKNVFDGYRIILPFNDLESNFRVICKKNRLNHEVIYKDYKNHLYRNNDLVISNPPFSLVREIVDYFISKNIKFILIIPQHAYSYNIIFNFWKKGLVRFIDINIKNFLTPNGEIKVIQTYLLTNLDEQEYPSIFWEPKKQHCMFDFLNGNKIVFNQVGKDFKYLIKEFEGSRLYFPITFLRTKYAFENKSKLEKNNKLYRADGSMYFERIEIKGVKNEK